jgi:hypothetical protein
MRNRKPTLLTAIAVVTIFYIVVPNPVTLISQKR